MSTTVAQKLQIIKSKKRPTIDEYISEIFDDFIEFHGDRYFGEDMAMCGGIATINSTPVTVIGHRHGKTTEDNIKTNFGMPQPEGYRKALRLAKQAEKFNRPVIFLVDTPGAFCGVEAENRGQGSAIAQCIYEFMGLKVPIISIVTGEGGSGGALAIAIANEIYMLENAMYSVISPRGFASILWKDATREMEAAELLKMTASDLYNFGIIEGVIPEGKTNNDIFENMKSTIINSIFRLSEYNGEVCSDLRHQKFQSIGIFNEIINK